MISSLFNTFRRPIALILTILLSSIPALAGLTIAGSNGITASGADGISYVGTNGITASGADSILAFSPNGITASALTEQPHPAPMALPRTALIASLPRAPIRQ